MTAGPQKNWSPDFVRDILPLQAICIFLIHWFLPIRGVVKATLMIA